MPALDFGLEGLLLVVSSIALVFIVKAKRTLIIRTLNRGIFFLSFVIFLEIVENAAGISMGFRREADTLTLETVTLAITVTALYYAVSSKRERARESLGIATICAVWVVMACALEILLGLILRRGG